MASLYTFSSETADKLKKFSFSSARSSTMKAVIYEIDKKTYEIKQDDEAGVVESLEKLEEELPDNSPRYVVVSYPVTLPDGRKSNPYVMLYYLPPNSSQNERMLYAQATELFKSRANVSRMIEIKESEDFEDIPKLLSS